MARHIQLPYHLYVNINNKYLGPNMPEGTTKGIWHAIYSRPFQSLMAHVLLESGAHWSGLPIHAISSSEDFKYDDKTLMPWSGMGNDIEAIHFEYLEGLPVNTLQPLKTAGRHTGIIIDWSDGYSRYPQEHKPLNLINLQNGQFALLPNNFALYTDKHFTNDESKKHLKYYLRGEKIYWGE